MNFRTHLWPLFETSSSPLAALSYTLPRNRHWRNCKGQTE